MNEPPKYLIVLDQGGCECVIVFNCILTHAQVAGDMNVISAGFCRLPNRLNDNVSAWGESNSLKIKSRGDEDADLILRYVSPQDD